MTPVALQGGKPILHAGKVGLGEPCCCGGCVCPTECVEGLQISLGNAPTCAGGFYFDFLPCLSGSVSASMYCASGVWVVSVSVCCFENGGTCLYSYAAELPCESDGLPPAGNVALVELFGFDDGGCPPLPPAVSVIK